MDVAIDVAWRRFRETYALLTARGLALRWEKGPYAISPGGGFMFAAGWTLFHSLLAVLNEAIERRAGSDAPASQRERLAWLTAEAPEEDRELIRALAVQYDRLFGERVVGDEELEGIAEGDRAEFKAMLQRSGRRVRPPFERVFGPSVDAVERILLNWGLIEKAPAFTMSATVSWHYRPGNTIAAPGPQNIGVMHTLSDGDGDESSSFTALPLDPTEPLDWEPGLGDIEAKVAGWERFVAGATNKTNEALEGTAGLAWYGPYLAKEMVALDGDIVAMSEVRAAAPEEHHERIDAMTIRLAAVRERLAELCERLKAIA